MLGLLLPIMSVAQTEGYDPSNPPNPEWAEADTTTFYTLRCVSIPAGAGSFNSSSNGKYIAGKKVTVSANNHNGCYFIEWRDAEGNTLSTKNSYTLTMPASDLTLYAMYTYDPQSPSDPVYTGQYMLALVSKPEVAGSFNRSSQKETEGTVVSINAYRNNGFVFKYWQDQNGNVLGTSQDLKFMMPSEPTTLTAVFDYAPEVPANPGTNSWDKLSGELIMDYFTPGNLLGGMDQMVGSANRSTVTHLLVDGQFSRNDYNIFNYYTMLTVIDLSRTAGVEEIPSNTFQNYTNLQELELPAGITTVGRRAFDGCTMLKGIEIYATVPPSVGADAFNGVQSECIIYVPEESVPLYEAAEGWNQFTISPLRSKVCSLQLNLPAECIDGRYRNMNLEIVNIKSGQRYKYVITDRLSYTFSNLVRNTQYIVYLKNLSGHIIGQLGDTQTPVIVDQDNVTATFTDLKMPREVSLKVVTPESQDVTGSVTVTWTDADGVFLTKGNRLESQLAGHEVSYSISLPQALALKYLNPAQTSYQVVEGENAIVCTLAPIPAVNVTGKLVNSTTGLPVSGASLSVTQTLNGQYSSATTHTVSSNGSFSIPVFDAPGTITITANDYVTKQIDIMQLLADNGTPDLGNVSLNAINGAVIELSFSYKESADADYPIAALPYYTDYKNVSYTIFNKTTGAEVTQFSAQYPRIVGLENVSVGDELEITAHSTTGSFGDVTVAGTVNENNTLSAKFRLTQYGGIFARFLVTDNVAVEGILYDKSGTLVNHATYNTNFTQYEDQLGDMLRHDGTPNYVFFPELADGDYTLITMGKSSYFNGIFTLDNLASAGLVEGQDYVINSVSVKSGVISSLRNVVVPLFDESKFYYTGKNTSFSVNKAQVIAGNYLTLNGKVDFLDAYKNDISNVELVITLPANSRMVENSVIVGNTLSSYEYRDNTVTIPLGENYTDRAKFCIVPSERGNYSPDAFVRFELDGKTIQQPIGSARYTVTDLTIWTPSLISLPTISIDGNAAAQSQITVYDGETVIGTTKALSDGYWSLQTELKNPRNLSIHQIHAEVVSPSGFTQSTETRTVEYNVASIQAKDVEMTFWNGNIGVHRTIWVGFDLEHVKASSKSYMFAGGTEFVFTANLTNNSPEVVHSCTIRVFTNNHEWIELPANYIENLDRWVAHSTFDNQHMPIGVRVSVDADISTAIDQADVDEMEQFIPDAVQDAIEYAEELEQLPVSEVEVVVGIDNNNFYASNNFLAYYPVSDENIPVAQIHTERSDNQQPDFQPSDTLQMLTTTDSKILVFIEENEDNASHPDIAIKTDSSYFELAWDGKWEDEWEDDWKDEWLDEWDEEEDEETIKSAPSRDRIATELVTALKERILTLEAASVMVSDFINTKAEGINTQLNAVNAQIEAGIGNIAALETTRFQLSAALDEVNGYVSIVRDINTLVQYAHYGIEDVNNWQAFIDRLLPCNGLDDAQARALQWISEELKTRYGKRYIAACDVATIAAFLITSVQNDKSDKPLLNKVQAATGKYLCEVATTIYKETRAASNNSLRKSKRDRNRYDCAYDMAEEIDDKWDYSLPYPIVDPIIDPSGYVYEGVSSNRLEGVTATAYYKHTYEDMYGDLQEETILWDAAQYSQENPLYTDEKGMYQWDVPEGLWQVKFEKEGYQTTYSEWLPVPPPQMDVNIGMVQNVQPEVISARAFEAGQDSTGGVEITFSKYMRPETLIADNIYLKGIKDNVQTIIENQGIAYPDIENVIEGNDVQYASRVSIATQDLSSFDEVYVIVSQKVESYAGINMTETWQQKLDIEKKLVSITVDSILNVGYGQKTTMYIGGLPTLAASGKKVRITSASALVATLGNESAESIEITFNEEGQAEFTVNGSLYGTTALQFEVINENISQTTLVNVVDTAMLQEVKIPVASRISGSQVYRGQTVSLSCETQGATIYYTTDGSCPCESSTAKVYTGPIAINEDMTLRIMAVSYTGEESEIREYSYTILRSTNSIDLQEGWNWVSHDLATPLSVNQLDIPAVQRIESQSRQAVRDSVSFTGSLTEIPAGASMKVLATETATGISLSGERFYPDGTPITMRKGWNWIGYPGLQTLSLNDALVNLNAEEGDVISSLSDGYAIYSDGKWNGSLKTLVPGLGYQFRAGSQKQLVYGTQDTEKGSLLYPRQNASTRWSTDAHKYPDVMCITLQLIDAAEIIMDDTYMVAAFVGEECRGVAQYENGLFYLPVHGTSTETVTFRAYKSTTDEEFVISGTKSFESDAIGSVKDPYTLKLSIADSVDSVHGENAENNAIYNLKGQKLIQPDGQDGIYIINGKLIWK